MAVVAAWDADDTSEGSNAKVTYLIQKNAMHESTGDAIFSLHPETGLVRTAVCCLDRETTPEYQIQVVATDGGGLQGKCHHCYQKHTAGYLISSPYFSTTLAFMNRDF